MSEETGRKIGKHGAHGLTVLLAALCLTGTVTITSAESTADQRVTHTPVDELQWQKTPSGREISSVAGSMETGPHTTFIKFAPGMKTVPHTHSNDYYGIVVKGTARHYEPGREESKVLLPAGSHWAVPANVVHVSECLPGSACIFAVSQKSFFDIKPVN